MVVIKFAKLLSRGFVTYTFRWPTRSLHRRDNGGTRVVNHSHCSLPKQLFSCALCALLTLPLVYILLYPSPSSISCISPLAPPSQAHRTRTQRPLVPPLQARLQCNYSDGKWVWDDSVAGRRYDSEKCDLNDRQKCVPNGKPDNGYLHWRWQPAGCNLSALDPAAFLRAFRGKRLAFVGDSTARNQAEALVCLLSTFSRPETVHRNQDRLGRRFWRWAFPAPHDVNVSSYWSPFLVRSEGTSEHYGMKQETVILDDLTQPWTSDVDAMDVMVISAGHWFPRPALYYDDGVIAGVYSRPDVNKTNIDGAYIDVYRTVMRRVLAYVNAKPTTDKLVVVATVAPGHIDARYGSNHRDACSRPKPYEEGEARVGGMEAELRKVVLEETAEAAVQGRRSGIRFEVMDVTRLASMRPDAHPGPYFFPHAYAGREVPETAPNDCLHWCAPGPVDTFNDILMDMVAASG